MATELVPKQFLHEFINLTIKKFDNFPQNTGYLMIYFFFLTNQFSLCTSVTTEEFPLLFNRNIFTSSFYFLKVEIQPNTFHYSFISVYRKKQLYTGGHSCLGYIAVQVYSTVQLTLSTLSHKCFQTISSLLSVLN